jgi:hypothetical protein
MSAEPYLSESLTSASAVALPVDKEKKRLNDSESCDLQKLAKKHGHAFSHQWI